MGLGGGRKAKRRWSGQEGYPGVRKRKEVGCVEWASVGLRAGCVEQRCWSQVVCIGCGLPIRGVPVAGHVVAARGRCVGPRADARAFRRAGCWLVPPVWPESSATAPEPGHPGRLRRRYAMARATLDARIPARCDALRPYRRNQPAQTSPRALDRDPRPDGRMEFASPAGRPPRGTWA